jgi:hypothetical protein
MIVRRGFNHPPPQSYHIDRLRQAPVGYFFDVITNGLGAMPDYAAQIETRDRWAIVAYVRVLQLSQNASHERCAARGAPRWPKEERSNAGRGSRTFLRHPAGSAARHARLADALLASARWR